MKTKTDFIKAYRAALLVHYGTDWARDERKLARLLAYAELTISSRPDGAVWNHHGEAVNDAAKACGLKARPTLKALRALPEPTGGFWVYQNRGDVVIEAVLVGEARPEASMWAATREEAAGVARAMAADWR